ncbi:MAG: DEAD/DEAH box helicase family protein [Caldilineaceae bacterium]|nr:DEAD/DEAH box helicase family protein [Caldilineaceae bacterium]
MHRQVNAISGRLSLRPPQRRSLEILDRVVAITGLDQQVRSSQLRTPDRLAAMREVIASEFPTVTDFERDFPSLCFALATGVGKTRLMGAFISYLYLAHGLRNFFVLAPNLTIYNKLIADFTPNTPKYVFKGIAEFAVTPPVIVTGDNYASGIGTRNERVLQPQLLTDPQHSGEVHINIFNISKINAEVRGGKSPRIKRLSEYIGDSYFNYLAELPDLVLLMDESHRYRADAGLRAINELKPILGLELTATPFIETSKGAIPFKNVIYDYPLARALEDGFIKEPAVVTQKNFQPQNYDREALERIKLEDGIRLHESVKVELDTFARQNYPGTNNKRVKPFMLVIARDTVHARDLLERIQSPTFFEGRYADKVIQVDSTTKGSKEDEIVERLLAVESPDEPTEIVIHVNMLKEGWDVTNLYTIVPLRAANARILIEQSIGRGLRLPFGRRTGVAAVDRLNIVAHDRFQEIIDEANRPDSMIRLQRLELDASGQAPRPQAVIAAPNLLKLLGPAKATPPTTPALVTTSESDHPITPAAGQPSPFRTVAEQQAAQLTYQTIQRYSRLPSSAALQQPEIQQKLLAEVREQFIVPSQSNLPGLEAESALDLAAVVRQVTTMVQQQTIDIPRIVVVPKGEVVTGFSPFALESSLIRYAPVERDLLLQNLRTNEQSSITVTNHVAAEARLEDYIVRSLVDYPDVAYDDQADLLYDLAGQLIHHLESYLQQDDVENVVRYHEKRLAALIYTQMQAHRWEKPVGYEVQVTSGFTPLRESAFIAEGVQQDFHQPPPAGLPIRRIIFSGFQRCLYPVQKFDSEPERRLAIILDREAQKWFKPARGQFQIYYKAGIEHREYVPDFIAETATQLYMFEPKANHEVDTDEVQEKRKAAEVWCQHASNHASQYGGKAWRYVLLPQDLIAENMTLAGLVAHV